MRRILLKMAGNALSLVAMNGNQQPFLLSPIDSITADRTMGAFNATLLEDQNVGSTRRHEKQRIQQRAMQEKRTMAETKARQERFNKGLRGLFDRITGAYSKTKRRMSLKPIRLSNATGNNATHSYWRVLSSA